MKIGLISYLNTKPFYFGWNDYDDSLIKGSPKELSDLARQGKVDAAPLPIVETWKMEDSFEPLGTWGIGVKTHCKSVFLLSKKPIEFLSNVTIGVSTESYTSIALLRLLIEQRYNNQVNLKRGFGEEDAAWLVIGDQALQYWQSPPKDRFPFCIDLAEEWWKWKSLPFVFARWVVRKSVEDSERQRLSFMINESLKIKDFSIKLIAESSAASLYMDTKHLHEYLSNFQYQLGPEEISAISQFRNLYESHIQVSL